MTKISGSTFYFKKAFPTAWFGVLTFMAAALIVLGNASIVFLLALLFMAGFGFAIFKKLVWDLADEVYDHGDFLVFKKNGASQSVRFEEIININHNPMMSPERIILSLRIPGPLGKELAFCPPMKLNPFAKSPIVSDLILRMDNARRA